ncbi:HIT family protein [Candidatus Marinamargulisbacteria bacterium SCGC AG-343-K17]|nr:HIT family protein [Candidatus Marinamargulisbacteria bacterium SCGC AG-343-K17]
MSSIFTKIINGEIPCHKIAENDQFFSFMDIRPISPGHTLVIPKVEIDRFFDLDNDVLSHFLPFAKPIAEAIEAVIPCERVGLMVAGLEVPHAHLHLVPIRNIGDLSFANATPANQDDLADIAQKIIANL